MIYRVFRTFQLSCNVTDTQSKLNKSLNTWGQENNVNRMWGVINAFSKTNSIHQVHFSPLEKLWIAGKNEVDKEINRVF